MRRSLPIALLLFVLTQSAGAAVCVNRFVARTEGAKQIVTLLTGKLTFQEATDLAKQRVVFSWMDEAGKVIANSIDVKALRPMPVGCDGKTSGVVMQVTFLATKHPSRKMLVKLGSADKVDFEEQAGSD